MIYLVIFMQHLIINNPARKSKAFSIYYLLFTIYDLIENCLWRLKERIFRVKNRFSGHKFRISGFRRLYLLADFKILEVVLIERDK